jgi:hypothetical protein
MASLVFLSVNKYIVVLPHNLLFRVVDVLVRRWRVCSCALLVLEKTYTPSIYRFNYSAELGLGYGLAVT